MSSSSDISQFSSDEEEKKKSSSQISQFSSSGSKKEDSEEEFLQKIFKKQKLPKPTLKRPKRQGMCLWSQDENSTSESDCETKNIDHNIIKIDDDPELENAMINHDS